MIEIKMQINDALNKDINDFCLTNNIETDKFLTKALESGYLIEKYGLPYTDGRKETPKIKEELEPVIENKKEITDIYGE